jgi:MFS family permease
VETPREPVEERAVTLSSRIRGLAVDVAPLRASRDYRLLWSGQLVSLTGHQITVVAAFYQVFALTRSPAAVGLVGLVQLVPLVASTIGLGPVVDRVDRRKILLATEAGFVCASTILLLGALSGRPPLALVYGAVALTAGLSGLSSPARSALVPNLVTREQLPAAMALNQVMWNSTMIAGPALAGVIIARVGLSWAYAIDVITYGASIAAALRMRPQPPHRSGEGPTASGVAAIREAFRFLKGRRVLQSTFVVDLVAMIFGMPRALFPVLAVTQFHRGPEAVGALFASVAFGALAAALTAGWVGRVRRQGRAVLFAVAAWGAFIAAFGAAGNRLILGMCFLAAAGAADVISAVFRGTILQSSVPDALRGRLSGVHILVVTGGPRLGDLEAGLVAQAFTPAASVISGGIACVAGVAVLAVLVPEFARYRPPSAR